MQPRRVTAPDGTKWIVGRRWLLSPPRYFGFRFGVDRKDPVYEPALAPPRHRVRREPAPTKPPTKPPVRYTEEDRQLLTRPRERRRGSGVFWGPGTFSWGGGGGRSSGSSGGGGLFGGSSGGGARGGSSGGGSRGGSSGGGKRGGGGGGAAGAGAALLAVLRYVLIVIAVIAAALFVMFVAIPTLVFLIHYLVFWLIVAATIVYRALSGRPWIVEMEEADGFRVRAWRVTGWRESRRVIDELANAVRHGATPVLAGAEEVDIVNASEPV